jgi:hypothetical protein
MAVTYFVRLAATPDLYIPLVRDDPYELCNPYVLNAESLRPARAPRCTDDQEILGAFFLGRPATLRDIQEGRARDISWGENAHVICAEARKIVDFRQEHFRDFLNRLSGPVYGVRIEDVRDRSYPGDAAKIMISAALYRILNPTAPVSDQDTVYVVAHKDLTEWNPKPKPS